MRISAGKAKGRRLKTVAASAGSPLRPTASKVREAVFDIIGPRIRGATFLDLYAGTGAIGLEALSRGAGSAVFVEINRTRAEHIRKVGEELGFSDRMKVYRMSAAAYLKKAARSGGGFDLVFIDPPYRSGEVTKVLPLVSGEGILKAGGVVLVEHHSKEALPQSVGRLRQMKRYVYGDTAVTKFERIDRQGKE